MGFWQRFPKYAWEMSPQQKWQVGLGPKPKKSKLSWRELRRARKSSAATTAIRTKSKSLAALRLMGMSPAQTTANRRGSRKPARKRNSLMTLICSQTVSRDHEIAIEGTAIETV
jgi:hypothetical protein